MKKKELLEKLNGAYKEPQLRVIEQIRSELRCFEDDVEIENVDAIDTFFDNGGFREEWLASRDDGQVLRELQDILAQIRLWAKMFSREASNVTIEYMDKKTSGGMKIFLAIIAILAVSALVFLVLHLVIKDGWIGEHGDEIAEAFGTLDFSLGALGFIWERLSDMKKRKVQRRFDTAIESGDTGKVADTLKEQPFIEKLIKIKKSTIVEGDNNVVGNKNIVITIGGENHSEQKGTKSEQKDTKKDIPEISKIEDILQIFHF